MACVLTHVHIFLFFFAKQKNTWKESRQVFENRGDTISTISYVYFNRENYPACAELWSWYISVEKLFIISVNLTFPLFLSTPVFLLQTTFKGPNQYASLHAPFYFTQRIFVEYTTIFLSCLNKKVLNLINHIFLLFQ